jgi:hypothetical protein
VGQAEELEYGRECSGAPADTPFNIKGHVARGRISLNDHTLIYPSLRVSVRVCRCPRRVVDNLRCEARPIIPISKLNRAIGI